MGRKDIIKKVLSRYYIGDGPVVKIDLGRVEKEIIEAHMPLGQCFRFLCEERHKKYDGHLKDEN
jgi:hypothetical protein